MRSAFADILVPLVPLDCMQGPNMTPKKKKIINVIFFIFFILTQKVLIRLLLYLTCKLLYPPYEVRTGDTMV